MDLLSLLKSELSRAIAQIKQQEFLMEIRIPTLEEIVEKYSSFEATAEEPNYESLTKAELIELVKQYKRTARTDTVQELAKAMLRDEEFLAATYDQIAEAIRTIKPEAKTSSKSIASYVSKKRDEWELPPRFRISQPRAPKAPEAEDTEPEE
jgi:predicted nucleic-acid-binding protein